MLARRQLLIGRHARLDHAVSRGLDRDDLGGAEIFGAVDRRREAWNCRRSGCAQAGRRAPFRQARRPRAIPARRLSRPARTISRAPFGEPAVEGQEVHRRRADEIGDEHRSRAVVDFLRRAELLDDAVAHHRDLVGHRHRFHLVVGDVDGGRVDPVVQFAQLVHHQVAELGVERAERLVHQEALRPAHDGPAERDALAVAAGQAGHRTGRADDRSAAASRSPRRAGGFRPSASPAPAAESRCSSAHSCADRARRAGRRRRCRVRAARCMVTSSPSSRMLPGGRQFQPGDHAQRRRLAAAGRPEHARRTRRHRRRSWSPGPR